jgi:hypothetical protein
MTGSTPHRMLLQIKGRDLALRLLAQAGILGSADVVVSAGQAVRITMVQTTLFNSAPLFGTDFTTD